MFSEIRARSNETMTQPESLDEWLFDKYLLDFLEFTNA